MASNQPAYAPSPVATPSGQWPFGEQDGALPSEGPALFRDTPGAPTGPGALDGLPPLAAQPLPHPSTGAGGDGAEGPREPRLPRQRAGLPGLGGTAVGSTVLGIAAMAAVGGGVATATPASAAPTAPPIAPPGISAPSYDIPSHDAPSHDVARPPAAAPQPATATTTGTATATITAPDTDTADTAPVTTADTAPSPVRPATALADTDRAPTDTAKTAASAPAADPGEALCNRLIAHVTQQREAAARAEREATERQAAKEAAARKVREQAAAAKAEAEAKAKAAAEAAAKAEAERLARLAVSYGKPVASYTLTNAFGESSNMWATHTGQDFAAPTGTPVHAIHTGTVVSAGWAGSYGYRVVLRLDDGTELWYCHLSTMVVTSGKVTTGDTIGRVGATGNVPGPHLHLEVRPDGGAPVDPVPWLYGHEVAV